MPVFGVDTGAAAATAFAATRNTNKLIMDEPEWRSRPPACPLRQPTLNFALRRCDVHDKGQYGAGAETTLYGGLR